jgi:ribosomal protein L17
MLCEKVITIAKRRSAFSIPHNTKQVAQPKALHKIMTSIAQIVE